MIKKDLFVEVLEDAKKSDDYQNWLNKQLKLNGVDGYLFQPTCVDSVIKLLHTYFSEADSNDIISYFCFDLDYGRKWKPDTISEDGVDIDISTSEKLYDYLISENN